MSNGQHDKEGTAGGPHVRCFRILRVWSIHFHGGVVPAGIPRQLEEVHITAKELLPIVLGVAMWGPLWKGLSICDNATVVAIVNSQGGVRWTGPCT